MTDDEKIGSLVQCGWHKHTATAFVRAGGRCEYCGPDLLHDRLGYAVGEMDHLLPRAQHPQLVDCPDNWILSCRLCNSVKRDWDPAPGLASEPSRRIREGRKGVHLRTAGDVRPRLAQGQEDHGWRLGPIATGGMRAAMYWRYPLLGSPSWWGCSLRHRIRVG